MYWIRTFLADVLLRLSLFIRPAYDCPAGTGWASLPEYRDLI